jgi:acetolactate synthase I/III small subunit
VTKLIDVVHAFDHTGQSVYETEIALVKLACSVDQRTEILQIAEQYSAKVVDYGSESLMLRVFGVSDKLDAFLSLLRPYGIVELVRSGKILMTRGTGTT